MPTLKPMPGSDKPRPIKSEQDEQRYTPTPRREPLPVPLPGMFDEPTRCLKINKLWWSHVSGMIDTLSSPELWLGDDDEKIRALREIAALLAYDCGDSMPEPVDTYEAIKMGIYDAFNDMAKQLISGRVNNIAVGDDGTVSDPTTGGSEDVELPEDDPGTAIDETLGARMGGAIAVRQALKLFYDKIDNNYGPTNGTPLVSAADCKFQIKAYFPTDEVLMDAAIDNYYAYRAANGRHVFTPTSTFDYHLYCKGSNLQSWGKWLVDSSGYPAAKQQQMLLLSNALLDSFWSYYFEYGTQAPSSLYVEAPCYKIDTETFQLDMSTNNTPAYTTAGFWKGGHRMKIRVTGTFADSDNTDVLGDGMYFVTLSTGVKTFSSLSFTATGLSLPTAAQVPYESSHVYEFTIDKQGTGNHQVIFSKDNGAGMTLPNVTGILTITVEDLGEWAI